MVHCLTAHNLEQNNPNAAQVLGNAKGVFTTALSIFIFQNPYTVTSVSGYIITVAVRLRCISFLLAAILSVAAKPPTCVLLHLLLACSCMQLFDETILVETVLMHILNIAADFLPGRGLLCGGQTVPGAATGGQAAGPKRGQDISGLSGDASPP